MGLLNQANRWYEKVSNSTGLPLRLTISLELSALPGCAKAQCGAIVLQTMRVPCSSK